MSFYANIFCWTYFRLETSLKYFSEMVIFGTIMKDKEDKPNVEKQDSERYTIFHALMDAMNEKEKRKSKLRRFLHL